jgi:hypothetical protein
MNRTPLPQRRSHEVFSFHHWGQKFHAGIGRATPSAPIQEVWINTGKTGTQAETLARDSAVLISLGLQYGVPLNAMRKAIMRDLDGKASGPIGCLLDLLESNERDTESAPRVPDLPRTGSDALEPAI